MFGLTFFAMPLFFKHQKDIYKGENLYAVSCILGAYYPNIYTLPNSISVVPTSIREGRLETGHFNLE